MSTKKLSTPLIALGSAVGGILLFNAFRAGKRKAKNKKWLRWEIQFKEGASEAEKADAVSVLKKQIIDYLYKSLTPGVMIRSVKFSFKFSVNPDIGNRNGQITVWVQFGIAGKGAVGTPPVPPPPPIRELINNLPAAIQTINVVEIH